MWICLQRIAGFLIINRHPDLCDVVKQLQKQKCVFIWIVKEVYYKTVLPIMGTKNIFQIVFVKKKQAKRVLAIQRIACTDIISCSYNFLAISSKSFSLMSGRMPKRVKQKSYFIGSVGLIFARLAEISKAVLRSA